MSKVGMKSGINFTFIRIAALEVAVSAGKFNMLFCIAWS